MAILLLIRHGLTDQTGKRLYGTSLGITLSEEGRRQAEAIVSRLARIEVAAVYASPLERCVETARPLARARKLRTRRLARVSEVEYGELTGRTFRALRTSGIWRQLHRVPSSVRFPGGETLGEVQQRSVEALRGVAARHRDETVAVVTHGDVIRLVLAHHAGIHIDLYQRIDVDPGSISVLRTDGTTSRVLLLNDTALGSLPTY